MARTLYDKEGKPTFFRHNIDAEEALRYGDYTDQAPEGASEESEQKSEEQLRTEQDVTARADAGLPVTPEERPQVVETIPPDLRRDPAGETYVVGGAVTGETQPGPVSREVVDTFNPSLADRAQLFAWLRANEVEVGGNSGTDTLREKAFEKMQQMKSSSPRGRALKGEEPKE